MKLNQKGLIQWIALLILAVALPAVLYLTQKTQIFKPRAQAPGNFSLTATASSNPFTVPGSVTINATAQFPDANQEIETVKIYVGSRNGGVITWEANPITSQYCGDNNHTSGDPCAIQTFTDSYSASDTGTFVYRMDVEYRRYASEDPDEINYTVALWCKGDSVLALDYNHWCGPSSSAEVTARAVSQCPTSPTACWRDASNCTNQTGADTACAGRFGTGSTCTQTTGQPNTEDDGCTIPNTNSRDCSNDPDCDGLQCTVDQDDDNDGQRDTTDNDDDGDGISDSTDANDCDIDSTPTPTPGGGPGGTPSVNSIRLTPNPGNTAVIRNRSWVRGGGQITAEISVSNTNHIDAYYIREAGVGYATTSEASGHAVGEGPQCGIAMKQSCANVTPGSDTTWPTLCAPLDLNGTPAGAGGRLIAPPRYFFINGKIVLDDACFANIMGWEFEGAEFPTRYPKTHCKPVTCTNNQYPDHYVLPSDQTDQYGWSAWTSADEANWNARFNRSIDAVSVAASVPCSGTCSFNFNAPTPLPTNDVPQGKYFLIVNAHTSPHDGTEWSPSDQSCAWDRHIYQRDGSGVMNNIGDCSNASTEYYTSLFSPNYGARYLRGGTSNDFWVSTASLDRTGTPPGGGYSSTSGVGHVGATGGAARMYECRGGRLVEVSRSTCQMPNYCLSISNDPLSVPAFSRPGDIPQCRIDDCARTNPTGRCSSSTTSGCPTGQTNPHYSCSGTICQGSPGCGPSSGSGTCGSSTDCAGNTPTPPPPSPPPTTPPGGLPAKFKVANFDGSGVPTPDQCNTALAGPNVQFQNWTSTTTVQGNIPHTLRNVTGTPQYVCAQFYYVPSPGYAPQALGPVFSAPINYNPGGPTPTPTPTVTPTPTPTPSPTPTPAPVACTTFSLAGATPSGTNQFGGPIFNIPSSGDNRQINWQYSPANATVNIQANSPSGAQPIIINPVQPSDTVIRTAQIPSNTGTTARTYTITGSVTSGAVTRDCLPMSIVVAPAAAGSSCPDSYTSTEVKFKKPDNTGSWTATRPITAVESVRVAGFHNNQTSTLATDVELSVTGPQGYGDTITQNSIFTPLSDLPPGIYNFSARTIGKTGNACISTGQTGVLTVTAVSPSPTGAACTDKPTGDANLDGTTDLKDFNIWRNEKYGPLTTRSADFNCDTRVDEADFERWNRNFQP